MVRVMTRKKDQTLRVREERTYTGQYFVLTVVRDEEGLRYKLHTYEWGTRLLDRDEMLAELDKVLAELKAIREVVESAEDNADQR